MDSFLKVALRDYVVGLTIFDIELQRLQDWVHLFAGTIVEAYGSLTLRRYRRLDLYLSKEISEDYSTHLDVLRGGIELQGGDFACSVIYWFVVVENVIAIDVPPVIDNWEPLNVIRCVPEVRLIEVSDLDSALILFEEIEGDDSFSNLISHVEGLDQRDSLWLDRHIVPKT